MFVVGLIAVNALVVAILCVAFWKIEAAPMARYRQHRDLQHRLDHLHEQPDGVTMADIELLLGRTLPARRAAAVCALAGARDVPTLVLWTWIDLYDAELLALAVESGMSRHEMVHRVATGTAPDRRALEIFAAYRGAIAS
ncbi:hypothetical protein ACT8ZV_10520 [Nocardioides sp. MAHUQ-72]|uniref:hypothetical protein n=1 Tax=unclassified Nocardioides TaxID=2615069 RepID=UPI00360A46ED